MPKQKLTKSVVERLEPRCAELIVWDESLPGFGLRVKPNGNRSYVIQYRNRNTGASKRMTVGPHGPTLTFDQAKKQARIILADVLRGNDPAGKRRAERSGPTVADLARDYLERHAIPNKRPRSVRADCALIDQIIDPKLGRKKVVAVERRDIEAIHIGMTKRPYQANRLLALTSKMFNLAIAWKWRSDNPAKGILRYREEKRERWLSDEELRKLVEVLNSHPNQRASNLVRLQLLTGARIGEVLKAEWNDFDLERGVWTKPSHHTKQNRREHVPLSIEAQALVAKMFGKRAPVSPFVFPGDVCGKPLQDIKKFWRSICRQAGLVNYRLHDNRHTYASHLVSSGLSLEIVGRLLGHTQVATTKRYAHLADHPLRMATDRFSAKLTALQGGSQAA